MAINMMCMNNKEIKNAIGKLRADIGVVENYISKMKIHTDCNFEKELIKDMQFAISILVQQLNNGWIPTSERLPENKVRVQITKSTGVVSIGFCNVNSNEWREDGYILYSPPIAWKPLSESYKEEADAKSNECQG